MVGVTIEDIKKGIRKTNINIYRNQKVEISTRLIKYKYNENRDIRSHKIIRYTIFNSIYAKYHNNNKNFIAKIFESYGYKSTIDSMLFPRDVNVIKYVSDISSEDIYIFNSIDYAFFLICCHNNIISEEKIINFLKSIKYIFIHYEVITNDKFLQIGIVDFINYNICAAFYNNAISCILSCDRNFSYLLGNKDIYNKNFIYFPPEGYSIVNKYLPLEEYEKDIDILIYGTIHNIYHYRTKMVENIKSYAEANKYKIIIRDSDLNWSEKDELLKRSKIVLHIPSHEKLHTIPWAKISELMCKKVFFIAELTPEIYENINFIVTYSSVDDLHMKIDLYLSNNNLRHEMTEKCFEFISTRYNSDLLYKNLIENINMI